MKISVKVMRHKSKINLWKTEMSSVFHSIYGHGYGGPGIEGVPGMIVGGPGTPLEPGIPGITVGGVPGVSGG
jgi:hypothetical protein